MRLKILLATLAIAAFLMGNAAAFPIERQGETEGASVVDLTGRWQLNADLSDKPPQPGEPGQRGERAPGAGRRPGGHPPGGGGFPGGGGGRIGGGGMGRPSGDRPNPEGFAKMRDAMRASLEAPAELIITRKDDEVVFTSAGTGDVVRFLVTGKKMKTTAGGAEHEVKADYKDNTLVVESSFGPMKVIDTWRVSDDRKQLERLTKMEGGRPPGGGDREIRRLYDRVE